MSKLLTVKEVAERLGLSRVSILRLVNEGSLTTIEVIGGEKRTLRFQPEDIEKFLVSRERKAWRE